MLCFVAFFGSFPSTLESGEFPIWLMVKACTCLFAAVKYFRIGPVSVPNRSVAVSVGPCGARARKRDEDKGRLQTASATQTSPVS